MQAQSPNPGAPQYPQEAVGALYVHVPLCLSKCGYCDFYSLPNSLELAGPYVRAVGRELEQNAHLLRTPLNSIFIGGGTPTALQPPLLAELLENLSPYANDKTEFSIEANPCTVTDQTADILQNAGVNRVNLGAQSFVGDELKALGRIHGPQRIIEAWGTLHARRLDRLGLDLIYAAPGQTLDSWRFSLKTALDLKPDHLSCYALTIEDNTPFGRLRNIGRFVEMDESDQADCYNTAVKTAEAAGLRQYEISNFAKPGKRCAHNLTYWRNEPYLGLGPAAASYIKGVRRTNRPDLVAYIHAIRAGAEPPRSAEKLTGRAEMAETVMLALRMTEGLNRSAFVARFQIDPTEVFKRTIRRYCSQGALLLDQSRLRISPEAMLVSNTIIADILAEA